MTKLNGFVKTKQKSFYRVLNDDNSNLLFRDKLPQYLFEPKYKYS